MEADGGGARRGAVLLAVGAGRQSACSGIKWRFEPMLGEHCGFDWAGIWNGLGRRRRMAIAVDSCQGTCDAAGPKQTLESHSPPSPWRARWAPSSQAPPLISAARRYASSRSCAGWQSQQILPQTTQGRRRQCWIAEAVCVRQTTRRPAFLLCRIGLQISQIGCSPGRGGSPEPDSRAPRSKWNVLPSSAHPPTRKTALNVSPSACRGRAPTPTTASPATSRARASPGPTACAPP